MSGGQWPGGSIGRPEKPGLHRCYSSGKAHVTVPRAGIVMHELNGRLAPIGPKLNKNGHLFALGRQVPQVSRKIRATTLKVGRE